MEQTSASEDNLFVEREEAERLVSILTSISSSVADKNSALDRLRKIFDNYLECPTLLRNDVRSIVANLLQVARQSLASPGIGDEISFHQCSHALSAICALSKVRGRKDIQRLLSHEVEDVEPVLRALRQLALGDVDKHNCPFSGDTQQPQRWESLYVLWNWMETLSLVPFNCSALFADSSSVIDSLVDLGKMHLSQTGPTREAAASSLASWMSRPDLERTEIPKFVDWSRQILLEQCTRSLGHSDVFLLLGIIQTLVRTVKVSSSSREILLEYMAPLWDIFLQLEDLNVCDNNLLLRKFMVKWWSRMGCLHLPPSVTPWRYRRGRRSLADNLSKGLDSQRSSSSEQSPGSNTTTSSASHHEAGEDVSPLAVQHERALWHVPDQVEDAMGFILDKLQDSSTMVRWAAAKGIGRLTARLPSICADDVLDALLELFVDSEADQAWHGACLALAELARRGLLLPHRLSQLVPMVVRAIKYDVVRGQSSVGAHVRDAACYTYWSFARAYDPRVLKPYVSILSESIILTCLFDREVNCRRAASAAFQECVGRQGADNFKHGISILTVADYFSLGNRRDAYTKISLHVAQFTEYRRKIVDHVYRVKLHHWDEHIRWLASESLYGLTSLEPDYIVVVVLPFLLTASLDPSNIPTRHGAILGLAECIRALGERDVAIEASIPNVLLQEITEIVPEIEKRRLYRGRGGQIVRGAVCRLICCLCAAKTPFVSRQQVRLLDSIDACLPHPNEAIQGEACKALRELTRNYFPVGPNGPSDRLQKRVVDKYLDIVTTNENPASTRGFCLALGYLPAKLLAPSQTVLESVVTTLSKVGRHTAKVGNEKDAETRRNALLALRRVCQTVGLKVDIRRISAAKHGATGLDSKLVALVFDSFLTGLDDYNMDRRGDVGSWCRVESMKGLETMACLVVQQANQSLMPKLFSPVLATQVLGCILKQFSEKLDSVRVEAGGCLERILTMEEPEIPFIPEKQYLRKCFGLEIENYEKQKPITGTSNWADASLTFPMVAKASKVQAYFPAIIAGMVISVGGLTESIAKASSAALLQLAKEAKGNSRLTELGNVLLGLFHSHSRDGRVILPLLKAIGTLLSHQCLDELLSNDQCGFKKSLLVHISTESKNCKDIHRQFACIDVALGLVGGPSHGSEDALAFACSQLLHSFPRVRRYAAEQIYVCLLEHPEQVVVPDGESVLEVLLEFPWDDSNRKATHYREMAQKVADAVGVPLLLGDLTTRGVDSAKERVHRDDFASYAALVDTVKKN